MTAHGTNVCKLEQSIHAPFIRTFRHSATLSKRILSPPNFELNSLCSQDVEPGWQVPHGKHHLPWILVATIATNGCQMASPLMAFKWSAMMETYFKEKTCLTNKHVPVFFLLNFFQSFLDMQNDKWYCSFGGLVFPLPFSLSNAHDRWEPSTLNGWNMDGPCRKNWKLDLSTNRNQSMIGEKSDEIGWIWFNKLLI